MHFFRIQFLLYIGCIFLLYPSPAIAQHQTSDRFTLQGRVIDELTGEGIPFANLYVETLFQGTGCDQNGHFTLILPNNQKDIQVRISSLGYASCTISVNARNRLIKIPLKPQSIELQEFTVTARHLKTGSEVRIDQESLEYIQPTSVSDVFQLLPGGLTGSNNMQERLFISSRQAGSDQSTSFGMGVSADGIPMNNDGQRIQMSGFTGKPSVDPNSNTAVNSGIDLRNLSTDHIESITINRGIAPAREGNLSSGQIQITSKKGKTPLRIRTKLDPLNKLAYVSKGFLLPGNGGTLHIGADITQSASDIRDTRSAYNRITGQANYNHTFYLGGKKMDFNQKFSYIRSFNNNKSDEEIEENQETYRTSYERYTLSGKITGYLNTRWIDQVELLVSGDLTNDLLTHDKKVINPTILCIQESTEEGEHTGKYLPASYRTSYRIDNRPANFFCSLNASKTHIVSEKLNCSVAIGTSLSSVKNFGEGAMVDPERPPFPSSSFIRPRPNYSIPALHNLAYYTDVKFRYSHRSHELIASAGLRGTQMFNLPDGYNLDRKLMIEPRTQLSYSLKKQLGGIRIESGLRAGFGIENKLPSIDYLYPDKVYEDFIVLNAYFNEPEKRLLLTNTFIHNPENRSLQANRNLKGEIGYDLNIEGVQFSVTWFRELLKGGIEYFTHYRPVQYTYYTELKHPVEGRPSKEDFYSYLRKDFTTYQTPENSSRILKKGLEYRVSIPRIECIKSDIEINGAYYRTVYTSGIPVMFRPSITEDNKPYPYVGIYNGFDKTYTERFNTNFWINTHIPSIKLIFTNFIQIVWLESSRLGRDVDVYPSAYLDTDGNRHEVTPEEIERTPQLRSLKRDFTSPRYNKALYPPSMTMNIKLTKEFSRKVRLSFFANNLFHINPTYQSIYMKTQRKWSSPFFGTELILNFQ